MSDIDTAVVDGLKALDPKWPIREADIRPSRRDVGIGPGIAFRDIRYAREALDGEG